MEEKYSMFILQMHNILKYRKGYGGNLIRSHDSNDSIGKREKSIRRWPRECIGI